MDPMRHIEQQMINEICPNPDTMTYEQLMELEEKMGSVCKGFSKQEINVSILLMLNLTKTY